MNETLLSLNYGQHILFGMLCTSLHGNYRPLTKDELISLAKGIQSVTDEYFYPDSDSPDVLIMTNPDKAYDIFCDFYDENKEYLLDLLFLGDEE